jgi:hypothetical protein
VMTWVVSCSIGLGGKSSGSWGSGFLESTEVLGGT